MHPSDGGESEKLKKGMEGGSMVQGQVFLKGGGWHFSYLIFIIFDKNFLSFKDLSFSYLAITLRFPDNLIYL